MSNTDPGILVIKSETDIFIEKLYYYGLQEYEVELIVARVLDNKPISVIVEEQHFISGNSVNYHFKKALKKLKERGFR